MLVFCNYSCMPCLHWLFCLTAIGVSLGCVRGKHYQKIIIPIFGLVHQNCAIQGSLQWRHDECDCISNHQPHDCLLNCLFRHRSKKTSKLCVTGLCAGNSPETGEFPTQRTSDVENVSNWWRHHVLSLYSFLSLSFLLTLFWLVCYCSLWLYFRQWTS